MRPTRAERQVRRAGVRPGYYGRRPLPPQRPRIDLSRLQVSGQWIKRAVIATVVLLMLLLAAQSTKLGKLTVTGTKGLDPAHIERVAREGLQRQWFGRNALMVNTGALEGYLESSEPGIKQADVRHDGLTGIAIKLAEHQPSLNWKTNNLTYLLDSDGTVIGQSRGEYTMLPVVTDSSNLPVKTGDRVAPAVFVQFCTEIARQLPGRGIKVGEMVVPETTSEVHVRTDKGFVLKFDTTRPAANELADLKAVQTELARTGKTAKEYIDLRIERKAYYK